MKIRLYDSRITNGQIQSILLEKLYKYLFYETYNSNEVNPNQHTLIPGYTGKLIFKPRCSIEIIVKESLKSIQKFNFAGNHYSVDLTFDHILLKVRPILYLYKKAYNIAYIKLKYPN